ncbi:chemotaxis protein CheA [Alicyclobacillus cellulosilyticus]|uniref:Chemotaxis protein CheA n=1 Tax=Alicyclobacillus cellulosilyticus TaxID=1003997 RepID=A0A917KH27_9BACL|nr:chemotaxis protein CheA [Alicyclobacillus cellulosilyticus]GGJ11099.1 chemotaxis protein CheA [Alicyclobacillus cellulosilyticus]
MDPTYLQAFLDESEENIQLLNEGCMALESGQRDDGLFSAMFRAAHTLKGMSATMGYQAMSQLTHRLEDVLSALRAAPDRTTQAHIDALFRAVDALGQLLGQIRATGEEGGADCADVVKELGSLLQPGDADAQTPSAPGTGMAGAASDRLWADWLADSAIRAAVDHFLRSGSSIGLLRVTVDPESPMKGARAVLVARQIDPVADVIACSPDAEAMQSGAFASDLYFLLALHGDEHDLVRAAANVTEVTDVRFEPLTAQRLAEAAGQDGAAETAATTDTATAAAASGAPVPGMRGGAGDAQGAGNGTGSPAGTPDAGRAPGRGAIADTTIRVSVQKLDALMNVLSELTVDKTRLATVAAELGHASLLQVTESISRLLGQLQQTAMSLRLVPVQVLFQRFPRMVRDLARTLGKEIQLEMAGTETELDRTIVDEMGEVLVHLLRNAADHGLEAPDDRVAAGKPAAGTIRLAAYQSGQHVVIEVTDDGRGIQVERIRQRAVERGLVSAEAASRLREEQVFAFMFASGFSTAETVSDISGRGVGLDAVKAKVEALGGRIGITSRAGHGTTFRIELPLTVAIIDGLLVQVHDDVYAIPLSNVAEVIRARPDDLDDIHGSPVLRLRGQVVPIIDAGLRWYDRPLLGAEAPRFVICRGGQRTVAVAVSRYLGHQQIVNKPLGAYLRRVRQFSGATILGDGRVALIVDVGPWLSGGLGA